MPKSEPAIEWEMRAYASVLHMRGGEHGPPTVQPFVGDGPTEDFMIFNGEIFDGINVRSNMRSLSLHCHSCATAADSQRIE